MRIGVRKNTDFSGFMACEMECDQMIYWFDFSMRIQMGKLRCNEVRLILNYNLHFLKILFWFPCEEVISRSGKVFGRWDSPFRKCGGKISISDVSKAVALRK